MLSNKGRGVDLRGDLNWQFAVSEPLIVAWDGTSPFRFFRQYWSCAGSLRISASARFCPGSGGRPEWKERDGDADARRAFMSRMEVQVHTAQWLSPKGDGFVHAMASLWLEVAMERKGVPQRRSGRGAARHHTGDKTDHRASCARCDRELKRRQNADEYSDGRCAG